MSSGNSGTANLLSNRKQIAEIKDQEAQNLVIQSIAKTNEQKEAAPEFIHLVNELEKEPNIQQRIDHVNNGGGVLIYERDIEINIEYTINADGSSTRNIEQKPSVKRYESIRDGEKFVMEMEVKNNLF